MNKAGKDYCKGVMRAATLLSREKKIPLPSYKWTDGPMQERIMRLGVELTVYEVDMFDTKHVEELAHTTLIEDWVNRNGSYQYNYSCEVEIPERRREDQIAARGTS